MQKNGIDLIADQGFGQAPVYRTDLNRCWPPEALSPTAKLRRWRTLEYSTDTLSGVMLVAGTDTAAPPVTYPLEVRGWHAVSIGVMPPKWDIERLEVQVKLTGDRVFTVLSLPRAEPRPGEPAGLTEFFWKVADLSGQNLQIGQIARREAPGDEPGSFLCAAAWVAYVKLVPLTEAEAATAQADRRRTDTRRLFAHNDAHGPHWLWRLTTADEVRREIEPYRDTDFARLYWEAGMGDLTFYFSKIGRLCTCEGLDDFTEHGQRLHAESWRCFYAQGVDPFDVALDYAHELGLEFHAAYRVAGFHFDPPIDHFNWGDSLYRAHPEWRGRDREGNATPRLAYTYPGARQFAVSLLQETAQRPIDGVCLLYNRRPPLIEYEPPLVEGFKQEFGRDPQELDPHDPDWLAYRARTLTQFMREVRQAMDEVARQQHRPQRIQVSAVVMGTERQNLYYGMDLQAWVEEGLVDTLIPYTSGPDLDSGAVSWADPRSLEYFLKLIEGTDVILAPNVMPRHQSPEEFRRRAATIYGAGAKHLFFWDCAGGAGRANYRAMWSALRRLGHRDEVEAWHRAGEPALGGPSMSLRRLGDWDLSYATPG